MITRLELSFNMIARSARLSKGLSQRELEAVCAASLHGKTPDEPDLAETVGAIYDRGYHTAADGTVWGLYHNEQRRCSELVRLFATAAA